MRRFKKQVEKAGILTELRRREAYDKPSVRKKKKAAAARKRALKKLRKMARGRAPTRAGGPADGGGVGRIPEETIEAIRNRIDIVDLVGRYVSLRQAGRSFKGLCP